MAESGQPSIPDALADRIRDATLAAAMAVKAAPPDTDVAVLAANTAVDQGAPPSAAASIGFTLRRVAADRIDAVASPETIEATARTAINAAMNAAGAAGATAVPIPAEPAAAGAAPAPSEAPPLSATSSARLNRTLATLDGWVPLAEVASRSRILDLDAVRTTLGKFDHDFVLVRDDNVFVTENGRRFIEYRSLAGGSY